MEDTCQKVPICYIIHLGAAVPTFPLPFYFSQWSIWRSYYAHAKIRKGPGGVMITPHPGERQQLCPVSSSIVSFLLFPQTAGRSQHRCGNGTLNSRPVCIYCTRRACSCNPLRLSALLWPHRTSAVHGWLRQKICPFLFTCCSSSNTEITSMNYRCESTATYVKETCNAHSIVQCVI